MVWERRWVHKEQFGCWGWGIWIWCVLFPGDATFCLSPTVCLHVCVMREETGFSSHRSLNSDSLNSLLEKLLNTQHGHLHTLAREGKCVLWKHAYDLNLAVFLPLYLQNPMDIIWYHNRVCFFPVPRQKTERKPISPSLRSLWCLRFLFLFFCFCPINSNSFFNLFLEVLYNIRSLFFTPLKRGHRPHPSYVFDIKNCSWPTRIWIRMKHKRHG